MKDEFAVQNRKKEDQLVAAPYNSNGVGFF
jgi:hypothetical protein